MSCVDFIFLFAKVLPLLSIFLLLTKHPHKKLGVFPPVWFSTPFLPSTPTISDPLHFTRELLFQIYAKKRKPFHLKDLSTYLLLLTGLPLISVALLFTTQKISPCKNNHKNTLHDQTHTLYALFPSSISLK